MYCKNCGTELSDNMMFCPECGEKNEIIGQEKPIEKNNQEETAEEPKTVIYEKVSGEEIAPSNDTYIQEETVKSEILDEEPIKEKMESSSDSTVLSKSMISVDRVKYCHNCGTANAESDDFCCACGKPFNTDTNAEQTKKKFKLNIKYIAAGIGAVAVLIFVIVLFGMIGGSKEKPLLYLKDNEINGVIGKDKTYVVGEDIYLDNDYVSGPYNSISWQIQFSEDNKYIFYPKNKTEEGRYDLYRREYGKENAEEIKVDSDISSYYVVDGNSILYMKDSKSNKLYFSDLKDKEKIASDVAWFQVSEDSKYILWKTDDGDERLYVQDIAMKDEKIKIDSDITEIVDISKDLKKIVYMKDDILYIVRNYTKKEKIASSVDRVDVFDINGDLELYYVIDEGEMAEIDINSIVNDDYEQEDANMIEPNIMDYQRTETKPSFWGPQETVVTDDAYYTALDKYQQKLERDEMRRLLSESMDVEAYKIYYYNGVTGEKDCILEGPVVDYYVADPVILYMFFDEEGIEPVSLSILMNMNENEIGERITETILEGIKVKMYQGGNATELDIDFEEYEDFYEVEANEEMKECYIVLNGRDYSNTLFKTGFTSNGSLELVAEEFSSIELITDKGIYYTTEEDDGVGELYFNSQKIDSDVKIGSCKKMENGSILYYTDPDDKTGTLYKYENGDKEKISDDVADYAGQEDGNIAFLVDYNFSKYRGDLKVYNNGKINSVDSDVTCILK